MHGSAGKLLSDLLEVLNFKHYTAHNMLIDHVAMNSFEPFKPHTVLACIHQHRAYDDNDFFSTDKDNCLQVHKKIFYDV